MSVAAKLVMTGAEGPADDRDTLQTRAPGRRLGSMPIRRPLD